MGRKPLSNKEETLVHTVYARITEEVYQRLKQMVKDGDCNSIGEAARRILSGDKINIFYVDDSLNLPMERLCEISSELRNISINISKVTKYFNSSSADNKLFHSLNVLQQYNQVTTRVDELLLIVSELAKKWLHT